MQYNFSVYIQSETATKSGVVNFECEANTLNYAFGLTLQYIKQKYTDAKKYGVVSVKLDNITEVERLDLIKFELLNSDFKLTGEL